MKMTKKQHAQHMKTMRQVFLYGYAELGDILATRFTPEEMADDFEKGFNFTLTGWEELAKLIDVERMATTEILDTTENRIEILKASARMEAIFVLTIRANQALRDRL